MTPISTRDVSQHVLYEVMWEQIRATEGGCRTNFSYEGRPLVGGSNRYTVSNGNVQNVIDRWSEFGLKFAGSGPFIF
jgi:hypothetical protein